MSLNIPLPPGALSLKVSRASPRVATEQGEWICSLEPWRGLGYAPAGLGRFLRRAALAKQLFVASDRRAAAPAGVIVVQPGVLLGDFVALLAVRPEAAGRGIGRALMAHVEAMTFVDRRWLYVSADATNRDALRFYRKAGFKRVGRLPDLVKPGRTEILLRKGRGA